MNAEVFHDWFIRLLEGLEEGCIIIMDNASYHLTVTEKAPTSSSKKQEVMEWLRSKNIQFQENWTQPKLLNIVRAHKATRKEYVIDELALEMGHEVVRLPPYHCQYNPIEKIWAQVKGYVAEHNKAFTMAEIRRLFDEGLAKVTADNWRKCVESAERLQEEDFIKEIWIYECGNQKYR
ncbi:uncharacterized protein LOC143188819 [Calliopsis andreniformis]|uniref:uncharacterized protein LOC143188819 n=1 Tax=Calliopsis andreniformis TaxID=337506 RepID=UPI003FCEC80F